ncbi:hypothetical protein [Agrobacterium salinitolerans]|uniref:hypothetical protein n=1 Tax=Agrobacterium salinitolerans TaxID=1183413 RepID=UPI0017490018
MVKGRILAHRGFWIKPEEKNSKGALLRALNSGYGIETDVRDLNGDLVISHDPPTVEALSFEWLLDQYVQTNSVGVLALNIKSDGLAKQLNNMLADRSIVSAFVFDMSVPDTLSYLSLETAVFCRMSEYEPTAAFDTPGVWLDNFSGEFDQLGSAAKLFEQKKAVAFVSPELHKRPHREFWQKLKPHVLEHNERVLICTDFPDQAEEYFGGGVGVSG